MSWQALKWAFDYDKHNCTAEWAVLILYANFADERGFSWPSHQFIASTCRLHRGTVARAVKALLVRRAIYETKKRRGTSGRVKVYRMPKITYENGLKSDSLPKGQSDGQLSGNCRTIAANKHTIPDPGSLIHKEEEGEATLPGPLAPVVKQVLFSLPPVSSVPSVPKKPPEVEHPWREEARRLYPSTDVDDHVLRLEKLAAQRNIVNVRRYVLDCLSKYPPTKSGEEPKRNARPRLDYAAELAKSEAKADRENGIAPSAPKTETRLGFMPREQMLAIIRDVFPNSKGTNQ